MKRGFKDAATVAAALAAFSGAVAGCNFLVGVGDYSIADGEAPETSTGDATTDAPVLADAGGTDGFDGALGAHDALADHVDAAQDAPAEGAQADAAEAGSHDGGDSGSGSSDSGVGDSGTNEAGASEGGPVDAGSDATESGAPACGAAIPTTTAFANLVKTCVEVASCDPFVLLVPISECITQDVLHASGVGTAFDCLSNITDCNGYYACQGVRFATASECPTFASQCIGNVAYNCDFSFLGQVTNCALIPGGTCVHHTEGSDDLADCIVQPSCTVAGTNTCVTNSNSTCTTVTGQATNVGLGRACVDATCTTASGVGCTFDGTALCDTENSSSCNGTTVAQQCGLPAQAFNYDCTTAGGTCAPNGATAALCVSPGCTAAQAANCVESCDGANTITVCVGGAPYAIDCTQYGFGSCNTTTGGNAYCAP
ncbi:MAG TPA: hypothetical protein VGM06_15660 [Polyangiaceae bacterium]|jgi:hypothetical protein